MDTAPSNEPEVVRLMALDLGEKRIGIAVSDQNWMVARGLEVIKRSSRKADFEKISQIAQEQHVCTIVVGNPILSNGEEGSRSAWARDYAADLAQTISIETVLWDESLTTADAEASLRDRGVPRDKRRQRIDAVAAAFILQSYIDYLCMEDARRLDDEE